MTADRAYQAIKDMERRQQEAVRRHGEMLRAKRDAVTFVRGPDGVYRHPLTT